MRLSDMEAPIMAKSRMMVKSTSQMTTSTVSSTACLTKSTNSLSGMTSCKSILYTVVLGQVASLLLCVTGACCHLLNNTYHLHLPAAVSFINYVLLCLVFTTWLACRKGETSLWRVIRTKGFKYLLLAVVDVEANYLVLRAYEFTSLTSVQLLDCFVVPVVLALSWLFLKVRYKLVHVLGVGLCLLGVGCLVWANVDDGRATIPGSERLLGDMLCLGGATLYGISNVAEEYAIKSTNSVVEFLGMIGLFGSIINGIQLTALEGSDVGLFHWDTLGTLRLIGGFSIAQFIFYIVVTFIVRNTSATALNLALFSTDFYTLITGVVLFKYQFHPLYIASIVLVSFGLIVFLLKPTPATFEEDEYEAYYKEMTPERCAPINSYNIEDPIVNHESGLFPVENSFDFNPVYHKQQLPSQFVRQTMCPECPECTYRNYPMPFLLNGYYSESMPSSPSKFMQPQTQTAPRRGSYSGCSTPYQSYMDLDDIVDDPPQHPHPTHHRSATLHRPSPRVRFMLDA